MSDIHLNTHDAEKLKEGIQEMTNCLIRMDSEKDALADIASALSKKTGIKKTILNKVAKAHHSHKYSEMQAENDRFEYVYERLMQNQEG